MRYLFWLWFLPLFLFWGWFGLSFYDVNFGMLFLRRELHDLVFAIYGEVLGVDPKTIPILFLKACIFDSFLIFGIVAYRKRKQIRAWWQKRRGIDRQAEDNAMPSLPAAAPVQLPAE